MLSGDLPKQTVIRADSLNSVFGQSRIPIFLASNSTVVGRATLSNCLPHIFGLRPPAQMSRIDATWIIARMQRNRAFRARTAVQMQRNAMRRLKPPID